MVNVFCIQCGAENPDGADFCHKCGKKLFRSDSTFPMIADNTQAEQATSETSRSGEAAKEAATATVAGFKGATAYGWLFIFTGFCLFIIGVGSVKPLGLFVALFQSLLFGATGLAILQMRKIAVSLVWVTTVLSGLGSIFRGLTPLDILLWLVALGLAISYTRKRRGLENSGVIPMVIAESNPAPQGVGSNLFGINAKRKRTALVIGGTCCFLVVVFGIGLWASLKSPQYARLRLRLMNVDQDAASFVKAASDGNTLGVELLLNTGMSPNTAAPDKVFGLIPAVRAAADAGHIDTVRLLLERGADPNTALPASAFKGHAEVVRLLLDKGADPNTALAAAASGRHSDIVRLLLDRGADPNQIDKNGYTPLMHVVEICCVHGLEPLRILLDAGADINKVTGKSCNSTPLMVAAFQGQTEELLFLLEKGADPNFKGGSDVSANGITPLMCAAMKGNTVIMKILLERGAVPDSKALSMLRFVQTLPRK
jgi:ankyrin repeat protein